MSRILGTVAAIGWGSAAVMGFIYWRSLGRIRTLRQQASYNERKLDRVRGEFTARLAGYESELEQARASARKAEASKIRFFNAIGERTRDPLHTISGYLQLLEKNLLLDRIARDSLRQIRSATEYLLATLDDIAEIVRLEEHQIPVQRSSFSLRRFLESIESIPRSGVLDKGLQLIFYLPEEAPAIIDTDERKLRQILLAVLDNAVKFTEKGRIVVRVGIADRSWLADEESERPESGEYSLLFEVEDTGIGIAPEKLQRIFDPREAIANDTERGIGLKLAIARRLARLMGGDIGIESVPDRGTLVKISVPVTEAREETWEGILRGAGSIVGLVPDQPEYRILVADDRADNRDILVKFLAPLGFQVKEARNGQETIAIWSTWRPHLIWLDTKMPVMDGQEAIQQIRHLESLGIAPAGSESENPTVIIALVTGILEEEANVLLTLGCDDVLRKPFELEIVLEKIAGYLGVRYLYAADPAERDFSNDEEEDMTTVPLTDLPRSAASAHFAGSSTNVVTFPRFGAGSLLPAGLLRGESLLVMPREWIETVLVEASAGDGDRLGGAIAAIPEGHADLSVGLTALVERFDFRKIRELCQDALAGGSFPDGQSRG